MPEPQFDEDRCESMEEEEIRRLEHAVKRQKKKIGEFEKEVARLKAFVRNPHKMEGLKARVESKVSNWEHFFPAGTDVEITGVQLDFKHANGKQITGVPAAFLTVFDNTKIEKDCDNECATSESVRDLKVAAESAGKGK